MMMLTELVSSRLLAFFMYYCSCNCSLDLDRLLEMNDLINTVVEKYAAVKNGQAVKSNELDRRMYDSQQPFSFPYFDPHVLHDSVTDKSAGNKSESPAKGAINLIDFDDNLMPASTPVVFDPFKKTSATSASNSQKPAGGGKNRRLV